MSFNFNLFHQDSFDIAFSNLPSITEMKDLSISDRFVKSLTIPEYTLVQILSNGPDGFLIKHPVGPKANADLGILAIEFKLSEDAINYLNLFECMMSVKYASNLNMTETDLFRKYVIKGININIKDNQKRKIATLTFTNAMLINLGGLSLEMGVAEEVLFSTAFSYEELKYNRFSIES